MQYEQVAKYVERLVDEGDSAFSKAYRKSIALQTYGVVPIDRSRGRFLQLVAMMTNPRRILEIGPGGGYSGLWFLKGVRSRCKLEVIEHHPHVAAEFEKTMTAAGFGGNIIIHLGPALGTLPHLNGYFDIIFIDADKDEYPSYLKHAMRLTRVGSVILADNMFWHGSVVGEKSGRGVNGIKKYTKMVFKDKRLKSLIVPLGDGLSVSYRVA